MTTHTFARRLGLAASFSVLAATLAGAQGAPPPRPASSDTIRPLPLVPASPAPSLRAPGRSAAALRPSAPTVLPDAQLPPRPVPPSPLRAVPATAAAVSATPDASLASRPAPPSLTVEPLSPAQRTANAPPRPSANQTGRCKDGTFLTGDVTEGSCSEHGGIAVRFSRPEPVPAPLARRP